MRRHLRFDRRPFALEDRTVPAVFTVLNTDDAGPGSLRQAVLDANALLDFDQIVFDATAFQSASTIALTTGEISVLDNVTITGPGSALLTINAGGLSRIFRVGGPTTYAAYIGGLTFTGGVANLQSNDTGGAVVLQSVNLGETDEYLSMTDCVFTGNSASSRGGAISLGGGILEMTNCSFSKNTAASGGAFNGGATGGATATLTSCSFSQNSAVGFAAAGGAFYNQGSSTFNLNNCQFTNNTAEGSGGGLGSQAGRFTINGATFTGNATGANGSGGAISAQSEFYLANVLISGNAASGGGGFSNQGKLTAINSAFVNNSSSSTTGSGGGISNQGDAYLTNCTVHNNTAGSGGGVGIPVGANTVRINNCTITGNSATFGLASGAGISFPSTAVVFMNNTVVAQNVFTTNKSANNVDVAGTVTSAKNNLIGTGTGNASLVNGVNGNKVGTSAAKIDPLLGPLQLNGGITLNRLPLTGSPLIGAGNNAYAIDTLLHVLTTDQRGAGFPRIVGNNVDIGAIETATAPSAPAFQVNDGAAQRSRVTSFTVGFSQVVTFVGAPAAAFQLTRTGPGGPTGNVTLTAGVVNNLVSTVTLTFAGALTEGNGTLIDGNYTLTTLASQIVGGFDGNGDGTPGDDQTRTLFRLFGDADGDRDVDLSDFTAFRNAFGNGAGIFDGDGDGDTDNSDFGAFRSRFGTNLP